MYPWYSEYLVISGRFDEAIAFARVAERLDPLSPVINTSVVTALYFARRFDEAIEQIRKGLEIDAEHFLPHFRLGQVYIQTKQYGSAIDSMQKAVALSGRSTETRAGLAQSYAAAGLRSQAKELLAELHRQSAQRYVSPYLTSKVCVCLGDENETFVCLEKASEARDPDLIEIRVEPLFDAICSTERFHALVKRLSQRAASS